MATIPKRLRELLDHYKFRWRAVQAAMGLLLALCAIVAGVGLCVLTDRALLGAPKGVRWAFLAAIALATAALLLRYVLTPLAKRMADERTAARLGRNFPNMAEDLVTGVELSRDQDAYGVSKGLVAAALSQIDQRSETVSWRQAVPLDRLGRIALAFALLGAAMGAAYVFRPEAVSNSIARLIHPNREDFFSYTKLKVEPGDQVLRKGDAMLIQVAASDAHSDVTRATLQVRPADGESFSSEITVAGGSGAWQSAPLLDDLRYRVKAGDNLSPWYTVRTVPAPALSGKSIRITPPAYTERPETTVQNVLGPVTVVNGPDRDGVAQPSTLVIQVQPAQRGAEPELACSAWLAAGKETYPMKPEGAWLVSPKLTPTKDMDYKITLKDGFGLTSRAPETISVKVVPDTKPMVTLPKPGMDLPQLPGSRVSIAASAADDYGVRDLRLQWRLVRDKTPADAALDDWKTVPLAEGKPTLQRLEGTYNLLLADCNAVPGDHIDLRAAASDYADDAIFRNGYSAIYRITIISYAEHLNQKLHELGDIAKELELASREQMKEAKATGEMKDAAAKDGKDADAAESKQKEDQLRDKVKDIENKISDVMQDLSDNPLTPSELIKDLNNMESAMQSTESKPMTEASDDLSKASESKPGKPSDSQDQQKQQQKSLDEAQKAQEKAAQELAQLSKEAARIPRRTLLEILADEAERLSRDQTDARDMTGKTATQIWGRNASELKPAELDKVARLAGFQKLIHDGIATLDKDIEKVLNELTQEKVSEADKASDALDRIQSDRLMENSDEVAAQIAVNNLFSQTPRQAAIADSLKEVAKTLRSSDDLANAEKQLQEFIKRQKELNARMEKLIQGDVKGADPAEQPPKRTGAGAMNNAPMRGGMNVGGVVQLQNFRPAPSPARRPRMQVILAQAQGSTPAPASAAAPPAPPEVKNVGSRIGERQGVLETDVSVHATGMRNLFRDLGLFKIETADTLDQASAEMGLAAQDLPVPSLPPALEHGKKALELLEEAARKLPSDEQQAEQAEGQQKEQMTMSEMLLLAKIIGQMKLLLADTGAGDRAKAASPDTFPERVMDLARRQGRIRYDATKLTRKLQVNLPKAAQVVDLAGGKMDVSHTALESGDAGPDTQTAQSEAIQLLEALQKDQKDSSSSSSSGGAKQAMARMSEGGGGGGYRGGSNGPNTPATLEKPDFSISTQQEYKDKMAAGAEGEIPPEFRGLVNAYSNQLRKEK